MNNDTTKSFIRHTLTVIGTILALVGIDTWVPVLDYLNQSLDAIWGALVTIVGFATTVFGFFKGKELPAKK